MAAKWYVVHTYSGQESKVFNHLQEVIQSGDLGEQIKQVLMPTQDVVQVKNGKKLKTTRKFFPSYVLVEMELSKDTVYAVRNSPGVTGFVGGNKPQPLRGEEVRRILGQTEKSSRQQISEVPFEIGDAVKIKEGPFKDFDGVVDEIYPEKGKIKVMVSVFGRQTPVEVDFMHVTPIS
ncbi:transcription termination/antitermination protein NusG [Chitinispirillales bacterium ANBcel5]|uniref:transcription termination/antitermination protein NusG n=1 Tax=Cellulosispirillum alkaliphilum TaxID=3039283 RepID=UPI002A55A6A9|nr:transcription termination/antitermination protein NusG [Chitinispirillales bacterium ANBcel5]